MHLYTFFKVCGLLVCTILLSALPVIAGTPISDRIATEAGVRAEAAKDLALAYVLPNDLTDRTCLNGKPVRGFEGDVVEYWANLECPYCGIREVVQAEKANPNLCIVVRHIPSSEYGESLKKALSYEALKKFSANAANMFWDKVVPDTSLGIAAPYEGALLQAAQEAAIAPEALGEALAKEATALVNEDILAAQGRIRTTPTFILAGIRFPACDFTATELATALGLAKEARQGNADALEKIVRITTNGQLNEQKL